MFETMTYRHFMVGVTIWIGMGSLFADRQPDASAGSSAVEPKVTEEKEDSDSGLSSYVLVEEDSVELVAARSGVATKTPLPLDLIPFNLGVVTKPLFISQQAQFLGDALNNVSGVATHTGFGVFDYFVIRGFDSLTTGLVLIDGAPESESTFYHLYNVERVEVLKGPGAFLYGGNPLAGSVNLIRKEAAFEDHSNVAGSIGSYGTVQGQLDLNREHSNGTLAFRLNTFGRRSDAYRDFKENWQAGINPSVSVGLGQRSLATVNFEYVHNHFNPDSGIPIFNNQIPDIPRTRSYQSPFDVSGQNIYRTRVDFASVINTSLTLRNKFYYTDVSWQSDGTIFPAVFPNAQGGLDVYRNIMLLDDRQRLFGNQTEAIVKFRTGGIRHSLLFGVELQRLGDVFTLDIANLPSIDLYNPVETASEPLDRIPQLSQTGDTRALVFAPYFLDQLSLVDSLTIFAGGRLDLLDFEDKMSGLKRENNHFSPLIGASYSPISNLALYVNVGQAFAPPSSRVVGERVPEESTQFEGGIKKKLFDGNGLVSMAVYHLQRDNIAILDETGVTRQTGSQRSRGFELDLSGELGADIHAFGSYAYTDARLTEFQELVDPSFGQLPPILVDRSGNWASFAPKHIFNVWLMKKLDWRFDLAGGTRFMSRQFIAADNRFSIDPSLTFDVSLSYRSEGWRVSLNVKNLTSTKYETRGFGSTSVLPANPFAVYLGVDFGR
jgi:TonB-dependent siderophore receptor